MSASQQPKTAAQVREEAAVVCLELEALWRETAARQQAIYDRVWIGGTENRKNAAIFNAAADGLLAVAKCIRSISLTESASEDRL